VRKGRGGATHGREGEEWGLNLKASLAWRRMCSQNQICFPKTSVLPRSHLVGVVSW
jgi:hypothetical protein